MNEEKIRICKHHGESIFALNTSGKWQCKKCRVERVVNNRRSVKQKAVDYKGGKCFCCGYNKSNRSLQFHHLDPHTKDYAISNNGGWKKIQAELDKCVLVCANCHGEIHDGVLILSL